MESAGKQEGLEDDKITAEIIDSRAASSPRANTTTLDAKLTSIRAACRDRDVEQLRVLATSEGGLLLDDARCQACSCSGKDLFGWG
jgi:hypothetical protein